MSTAKTKTNRKPRILVMEGLSGAAWCIRRAGGVPITVSPRMIDKVDEALAAGFDGLLLTGGGDVDPKLYGEKPHKKVYGVSEVRDYTEWQALDRARELGAAVMGICRGSQLMAVHNGGKLRQHVSGHRGGSHLVFAEKGSRFGRVIKGQAGTFVSLHHQVVSRTGPGWRVAGRGRDGLIEAVESRDGRCLGVQFHPEMDTSHNEASRRLFNWLVDESARRAGLTKPKRGKGGSWITESKPTRKPNRPQVPVLPARRLPFDEPTGGYAKPASTRARRRNGPVVSSWLCPHCAMRFDNSQDREDHVFWLHGDTSAKSPTLKLTEPPPGHPDWEDMGQWLQDNGFDPVPEED